MRGCNVRIERARLEIDIGLDNAASALTMSYTAHPNATTWREQAQVTHNPQSSCAACSSQPR